MEILLFQLICSVPAWCIVYLWYLAPAFAMSGLHLVVDENLTSMWSYLAYGLMYLMFQHLICVFFAHICKWSSLAAFFAGIVIGEMTLGGGVMLHLENLPTWYRQLSPLEWTLATLLPQVHAADVLNKLTTCKGQQVLRQDIIVQAPCEPPDGYLALRELALDGMSHWPEMRLGICIAVVGLLIIVGFLCVRYAVPKRPRSAPNKP